MSKYNTFGNYLHTCPICGKEFYCYEKDEWVYKVKSKLVCSYTCMNNGRKNNREYVRH